MDHNHALVLTELVNDEFIVVNFPLDSICIIIGKWLEAKFVRTQIATMSISLPNPRVPITPISPTWPRCSA